MYQPLGNSSQKSYRHFKLNKSTKKSANFFFLFSPLSVNSTHVNLVLEAKNSQRYAWCLHYFASLFQAKSWYFFIRACTIMIWPLLLSINDFDSLFLTYCCTSVLLLSIKLLKIIFFFLIFTFSSFTHTSLCSKFIYISKIYLKQSLTRHNCHLGKLCGTFLGLNLICFSSDSMNHWTFSETSPDSDLHDTLS